MTENTILKNLFSALQNEMSAKSGLSDVVNHPTDKGDNTESNWIDWFNQYLPKRYRAAKVTVIDCEGNVSDQIDIAIYDGQYSYLAFNENGILYIPAESVYAVFEIKQNLNKDHMEYAGKKAESVRILKRTSAEIPYAGGVYPPKAPKRILAGILTTRTDWKQPFGNAFKKRFMEYNENQRIDCGCVLSNGAFFYNYEINELSTSGGDESLVSFFLQLLILLQGMGTVPAIDLKEYMKALTVKKEIVDGKEKGL